jgi:hypothetical protein
MKISPQKLMKIVLRLFSGVLPNNLSKLMPEDKLK